MGTEGDVPALHPWVHDLDPFAIELWAGGGVRWYGLAYVAGFIVAALLIRRVLRAGQSPLPRTAAVDIVTALAIGAVVGARVGYVLLYAPELLWTFERSFPFWRALAIHEGGMASHGGMAGVVVAAVVVAHRRRVPVLHVLDLAAFGAPIGLFFGRLANFVNGELYGRVASATLPWGVKFPTETATWSGAELETLRVTVAPHFGAGPLPPSRSLASVVIERIQHGDSTLAELVAPLLPVRHPSQLYEALLEGIALFVLLAWVWRAPRRPGVVSAAFAIGYAFARISLEQFRQPDVQIASAEFARFGVTRGQWLSALLLLAGILVAMWVWRHPSPKLGGWRALQGQPRRKPTWTWLHRPGAPSRL